LRPGYVELDTDPVRLYRQLAGWNAYTIDEKAKISFRIEQITGWNTIDAYPP
jgi:hypothetical protein